jgi:hypothetical protein
MGFVIRRVDVLGLLGLSILALVARFHFPDHWVLVGETCAVLVLGLLLARHAAVRRAVGSLTPGFRALVVLFPALLVVGHVANRGDRAYPFVTWDLYVHVQRADPTYHEWIAVRAGGDPIALSERTLFPSLRRRITVALESVTSRALHGSVGPERERAAARLQTVLAALAREYERRRPGEPIRAIDVWHRTVPIETFQGRSSILRRHEHRVDVP